MLNSLKGILTETCRIIFDQISEHPVAQSSWHIKGTLTNDFPQNKDDQDLGLKSKPRHLCLEFFCFIMLFSDSSVTSEYYRKKHENW